jgi:hypothetical protein
VCVFTSTERGKVELENEFQESIDLKYLRIVCKKMTRSRPRNRPPTRLGTGLSKELT